MINRIFLDLVMGEEKEFFVLIKQTVSFRMQNFLNNERKTFLKPHS